MKGAVLSLSLAVALTASSASASAPVPRKVQISDPAGDANGVNDQVASSAAEADFGDVAAANTVPQADILKVWYSQTPETLTVHIQTAAPLPAPVPLYFMVKSNPNDSSRTGCSALYAAIETEVVEAMAGDCNSSYSEARATFEELPDGTGVLHIEADRPSSAYFMPGQKLVAPRAFSHHTTLRSQGMPPANLPVIDNTKPGADYKLR